MYEREECDGVQNSWETRREAGAKLKLSNNELAKSLKVVVPSELKGSHWNARHCFLARNAVTPIKNKSPQGLNKNLNLVGSVEASSKIKNMQKGKLNRSKAKALFGRAQFNLGKMRVEKSSNLRGQTFVTGVLILFIAGVVAKILGAVYRIPLTWILGAEGLGMYQLVYPLFSLILVLSSTGMPTAISRVTAKFIANGDIKSARATLGQSLKLLTIIGSIFAILLATFSTLIASLQGNINLYLCYLGLVPAVILVSVLSAFRGYFQGCSNMVPTATSQIVEQGGKLILGLICGYFLLPYGVEYGVLGALIGVSVSELFAVLIMLILYKKDRSLGYNSAQNWLHSTVHSTENMQLSQSDDAKTNKNLLRFEKSDKDCQNFCHKLRNEEILCAKKHNYTKNLQKIGKDEARLIRRQIVRNVIPITLSNAILPTVLFVESLFVVLLLVSSGLSTATATTFWGINTGIVGSLINMPIVLTQAVAIAIVPFVAVTREREGLQKRYNQALEISLTFCVPIVVAFVLLGEPILAVLYQSSLDSGEILLASQMLLAMSVSVIFGSILQTQNNMLQGLGFGKVTAIHMAISAIAQITLFVALTLTSLNIWGCVIASVAFYLIAFTLNYIFIRKKLLLNVSKIVTVPPVLGGLILSLYIINIRLMGVGDIWTLVLAIVGGGALYLFSIWVWGGFDRLKPQILHKKRV